MLRAACALAALLLVGCSAPRRPGIKALVGATLIDGTGAPPVAESVVLISGSRIRAAGPRAEIPVPPFAERIDARGMYVIPKLIDLAGNSHRGRLATALEDVRESAAEGERIFFGMVVDTDDVAPGDLGQWRREGLVFAPALSRFEGCGELLGRAMRNTRRLAAAGVAVALDSGDASGARTRRELELLRAAGLSPAQVVAAATRGSALALGRARELGTIQPGKRADLAILRRNPLADPRLLASADRRMRAGEWVR